MKRNKGLWLAAALITGAAALTGCSAQVTPSVTPTPNTNATITAQPATAQPDMAQATPDPSASAAGEETPGPLALYVSGEELKASAIEENGKLMLPLVETAEVLGWAAEEQETQEETQTRRSIVLTKDESRISVAWVVSDNTASRITWQKDGLLIPVDTKITTLGGVVYVPAAFFEAAMDASVQRRTDGILVAAPTPKATEETAAQGE
ncbi:MAG: hypothetical protein IKU34_06740 [Clostridia bacterium]|nr:hypothetical protein [Clostridia bacterium]